MSEVGVYRLSSGGHGYRLSLVGVVLMISVIVAVLPYVVSGDPTPFFSLATLFAVGWGLALVGGVRLSGGFNVASVLVGVAAGGAIAVSSLVLGLGRLSSSSAGFVVLFAAVAEEVFFRGGLQTVFTRVARSPVVGVIFSAGTFALFHWLVYPGYSYSYFYPLMAGFVLATAYEATHDLSASMVAHLLVNALVMLG